MCRIDEINVQVGKFFKKNKRSGGIFFLKINERAGKIPIHMQYVINVQGIIFPQNQ